jgi:hypothetical protein
VSDEPRAISHPVPGIHPPASPTPSAWRFGDLAVYNTMQALMVDEDTALEILGEYAEQGRVVISGDRRLVGLFVDETLFAIAERAWLRGWCIPASTRAVDADALA